MVDDLCRQSTGEAFDLMEKLDEEYIVLVEGLSFSYSERTVLNDLSFCVKKGESLLILGPSGVGKSTVLNVLGGLLKGFKGSITAPSADRIRMVFQKPRLFPWLSVRQNLHFALKAAEVPKEQWAERLEPLLELVGLTEELDRSVTQLSYGMAQRIALVRALCCHPDVLLLDEPFSALDPRRRSMLNTELKQFQQLLKTSIVMVTHDIEEAIFLGDQILVLDDDKSYCLSASQEQGCSLRDKLQDLLL